MTSETGKALIVFLLVLLAASCSPSNNDKMDSGTDTDTDTDSDTDIDSDSDTDSDTDTDIDSDTDTDTDTDSDTDTDTDSDTDTGPPTLPAGCQFVGPCNANFTGWKGWPSLDSDHMVWTWIDSSVSPQESVLVERRLSTGVQTDVVRSVSPIGTSAPSVKGSKIFFERETTPGDATTREVFEVDISTGAHSQVTSNIQADASIAAGENFVVYRSYEYADAGYNSALRFYDLNAHTEQYIAQYMSGTIALTFDGDHWVAFVDDYYLYKFDLNNPGAGAQLMYPDQLGITIMAFNHTTGELITGVNIPGVTNNVSIQAWDLATNTKRVIIDEDWDQIAPDSDGHLVAYLDSQVLSQNWYPSQLSQVKIIDLETSEKRTIVPHLDAQYGLALWNKWLAFNNVGVWGDVLVLCDLEAGGFIDSSGHVIPESSADAGVDGGALDGGI